MILKGEMVALCEWNTEVYWLFISDATHEMHSIGFPFFFEITFPVFWCQHSIKSSRDAASFVHSPYERRITSCPVDIYLIVNRLWYNTIRTFLHHQLNTKIAQKTLRLAFRRPPPPPQSSI